MRSVHALVAAAVVAVAIAVPAIAARGGAPVDQPTARPQPALCQTSVPRQLGLSAGQADALRSACTRFRRAVVVADHAYSAKVADLAPSDVATLRQARQERRTAVWAARDRFRAIAHDELGVARPYAGHGRDGAGGSAAMGSGVGGANGGRGPQRGMGGHGQCPYRAS